MAAERGVKLFGNEEALFRPRPGAKRTGQQRKRVAQSRLQRSAAAEYGGAVRLRAQFDEAARVAGPWRIEQGSRPQEQQPARARSAGRGFQPPRRPSWIGRAASGNARNGRACMVSLSSVVIPASS